MAYTLIRNPSLIPLTANNLEESKRIKLFDPLAGIEIGEEIGKKISEENKKISEEKEYYGDPVNPMQDKVNGTDM